MSRRHNPERRNVINLLRIQASSRGGALTVGAEVSEFLAMEMTDAESVEAEQIVKDLLKVIGRVVIRTSNREVGTKFEESASTFRETVLDPRSGHCFPAEEL